MQVLDHVGFAMERLTHARDSLAEAGVPEADELSEQVEVLLVLVRDFYDRCGG
jgi:hypothetical protein